MSSTEIEEALVPKFSETQFITLISTFPCLYHIHDRNHTKENAALCWDEIGNQLDYKGSNSNSNLYLHEIDAIFFRPWNTKEEMEIATKQIY